MTNICDGHAEEFAVKGLRQGDGEGEAVIDGKGEEEADQLVFVEGFEGGRLEPGKMGLGVCCEEAWFGDSLEGVCN
jgi:hypothetical protein